MQAIKFKKLARYFLQVGSEARAFVREPWYVSKVGLFGRLSAHPDHPPPVTPDRPSHSPNKEIFEYIRGILKEYV
jgi:hypothetical protein